MKFLFLCFVCIIFNLTSTLNEIPGATREDVSDQKYLSLAQEDQFEPVGLIKINDIPNASGVLVHESWVLTAGHVVIDLKPNELKFQLGENIYNVSKINIFPEYQKNGILGHNGDLALLQLNSPTKNVKPVSFYKDRDELGKVGVSVGFGRSGSGASIITNPTPVGTKRAGENVIDLIGGVVDERIIPDNLFISDFDHPTKEELNRTGSAKPVELEYCPVGGDSGAGLFIKKKNEWYLAGIFSAFTPRIHDDLDLGLHGSLMYWTRLSDFSEWLSKTINS